MRRRSDRKKSTDVQSSPAPPSRRSTRRSRKSQPSSDSEKNEENKYETSIERPIEKDKDEELKVGEQVEALPIEERRKARGSRNYTPVKELSPAKGANSRGDVDDPQFNTIPEEESVEEERVPTPVEQTSSLQQQNELNDEDNNKVDNEETIENRSSSSTPKEEINECNTVDDNVNSQELPAEKEEIEEAVSKEQIQPEEKDEMQKKEKEGKENEESHTHRTSRKSVDKENVDKSPTTVKEHQNHKQVTEVKETTIVKHPNNDDDLSPKKSQEVNSAAIAEKKTLRDLENEITHNNTTTSTTTTSNNKNNSSTETGRIRKRKWITKKATDTKVVPVLSISTDSLKELISDVQPVPLSDVRLESSSDIEEIESEREEGEESASDGESYHAIINNNKTEIKQQAVTTTPTLLSSIPSKRKVELSNTTNVEVNTGVTTALPVPHAPSPARNQSSNILYITNLVRPFTVLQLKGLLARTGNIVEDGFWIDRIKSKCYVHYETEDEAIETRHALHGIRWPVSNPKCLNVEFSTKADMDEAVRSTKDEAPKLSQDNTRDNYIIGGWNRDHSEISEKKTARPVREWDVGKKESLDRDKSRDVERRYSKERNSSAHNDADRKENDRRDRRGMKGRELRSNSLSPARKQKKKENDPPLRLLDDLFRKTKCTPCIYWLPLTPEQIAEKEAFRQKRIEEHKERIKQREQKRRSRSREVRDGDRRDRRRY